MTSTALTETSSPMYNTSEPTSPRVKTTQQSTSAATESNSSSSHTAPSTIESTETAHSTTTENTRATLKERRISTSQVPSSTGAEWKSTGSIHDVKSYRNEEMLSRKVMGVSLKYVIIASSSFVVVVFVSFVLVCQLCKRRCVNELIFRHLIRYQGGYLELLVMCVWLGLYWVNPRGRGSPKRFLYFISFLKWKKGWETIVSRVLLRAVGGRVFLGTSDPFFVQKKWRMIQKSACTPLTPWRIVFL